MYELPWLCSVEAQKRAMHLRLLMCHNKSKQLPGMRRDSACCAPTLEEELASTCGCCICNPNEYGLSSPDQLKGHAYMPITSGTWTCMQKRSTLCLEADALQLPEPASSSP